MTADGDDEWVPGQDCVLGAQSVTIFEYTLVAPTDTCDNCDVPQQADQTFQTAYEVNRGRSRCPDSSRMRADCTQTKSYKVVYRLMRGTLVSIPERIVLNHAYPHRVTTAPVLIYRCHHTCPMSPKRASSALIFSTFDRNMSLLRLSTLTNDARFVFETYDDGDADWHNHDDGQVARCRRRRRSEMMLMSLTLCSWRRPTPVPRAP